MNVIKANMFAANVGNNAWFLVGLLPDLVCCMSMVSDVCSNNRVIITIMAVSILY